MRDGSRLLSSRHLLMTRPRLVKENPSPLDRFAYAIATGAGAGFAPIAPGTFGAIEGLGIYLAASLLPLATMERLVLLGALNVVVFVAGVWASNRACAMCGIDDPGQVVIDEVSGQLIALMAVAHAPSPLAIITAFALFRLFDIYKPYPINRLERLRAGMGIMADDALAGVYAAALVAAGIHLHIL